jgi:hypothetical protein
MRKGSRIEKFETLQDRTPVQAAFSQSSRSQGNRLQANLLYGAACSLRYPAARSFLRNFKAYCDASALTASSAFTARRDALASPSRDQSEA